MLAVTVEDLRQLSLEPTTTRWALMLSATPASLWVVAREDGTAAPGPRCLWSKRYARPEGTSELDCLRAGITALSRASAEGRFRVS